MAGSTVVEPPSPSPSSSSASGSPASSRSVSPEPDGDAQSDREEPELTSLKPTSSRPSGRNRKGRANGRSRKPKTGGGPAQETEMDVDADQTVVQDADEVDAAEGEDVEPDSPEMELESDLQPAHRAEALDVLATIELKFALLRERLYVEKMENLAWEEALVVDGAHPELLHLHTELSKRRDKRLQLAARRRDYEIANVTKRRKLDEDGVWSWWKSERDELQTNMVSETNRKKRKLERERRALDRPQPERRIPPAPQIVEPPPTLRDIVKTYPFGISSSYSQPSRRKGQASPSALAYPQLSTLAPAEIAHDLDFLYQHRRMAPNFDHRSAMLTSTLGGPPPPHIYDYPMNLPMVDGPGTGNRFGPPPSSTIQHQHPHGYPQVPNPLVQGFPGQPPRLPHHHSAPAGGLPSLHPSQIVMDPDMAPVHRPDSRSALVGVHVQQQFASVGSTSAHGNLMRRSISPVQVQVLHHGPGHMPMSVGHGPMLPGGLKPNGWVGVGQPGPNSLPGSAKEPRKPSSVADGRERGKERERYPGEMEVDRVEREREADRELDKMHQMQITQQRHSGHQHPHPPIHSAQAQVPHRHLGPHHHHHHHHHIHHHHHPNGATNGGQGPLVPTLPPSRMGGSSALTHSHDPRFSESHSGVMGEAIELSASSSRQPNHRSPRMSALWKTNDEPPPLPPSGDLSQRERQALELLPLGPDERSMTPIGTMPTQVMQSKFSGSPRPTFVPPGSLGHWSGRGNGVEDMGDPAWRDRSINQAWPNGRRGREILNLPSLPPPPPLTSAAHSPPARAPSPSKGSSPGLKTLGRTPSSPNSKQPPPRLAGISGAEQQAAGGTSAANHLRTSPPLPLLTSPSHKFHKSVISEPLLGNSAVAPKAVPVDGSL
ncbi:uncharacterized protein FIBRA_01409 [Fibroporia radiculosa]|uniref:Sds3-like-domain-containing protein n=1 Tax=Fibroporia radiculosa TaxID=599839 RepID=J4I8G9_9APHY|nr:uncharacterized protein FIBRA_01409 [Fibroporia radiculosa]CCL99391.1 predicted protein [Fibroporia radiculosa]